MMKPILILTLIRLLMPLIVFDVKHKKLKDNEIAILIVCSIGGSMSCLVCIMLVMKRIIYAPLLLLSATIMTLGIDHMTNKTEKDMLSQMSEMGMLHV